MIEFQIIGILKYLDVQEALEKSDYTFIQNELYREYGTFYELDKVKESCNRVETERITHHNA